jgi:hypothetical protein
MIAPPKRTTEGRKGDRHYMFKDLVIGLRRILDLIHKLSLYVLYRLRRKSLMIGKFESCSRRTDPTYPLLSHPTWTRLRTSIDLSTAARRAYKRRLEIKIFNGGRMDRMGRKLYCLVRRRRVEYSKRGVEIMVREGKSLTRGMS